MYISKKQEQYIDGDTLAEFLGENAECSEVRMDELINGIPGEIELAISTLINGGA